MANNLGSPVKVNNFLPTLNKEPLPNKNLKDQEEHTGEVMIIHSAASTHNTTEDAFKGYME